MKIVHYPHPALRHAARPLTAISKKIERYVAEMLDLMYEIPALNGAKAVEITEEVIAGTGQPHILS